MATFTPLHEWPIATGEAIALQNQLRRDIRIVPPTRKIETIAGCDISFQKFATEIYARIVVLRLPTLEIIERVGVTSAARFPYVPGLLSFREAPALLEAWEKLQTEPDAVMLDGQGIAHPRRFGIGAHFGLWIGRPTFGCAKSVLIGKFDLPPPQRGEWSPMADKGEVIGAALRTKDRVSPVYISPGHLIDLETSIQLALACNGGYRVPEPTRQAHLYVNALRAGGVG